MPERKYILAAEPTVQNVSGQVQRFREVRERAGDGPWQVAAVVSDGDSVAVLDALRRTYSDGREDHAEDTDVQAREHWKALKAHIASMKQDAQRLADSTSGPMTGFGFEAQVEVLAAALSKMSELEAGR